MPPVEPRKPDGRDGWRASMARTAVAGERKVHLAIDTATGDSRGVEFTSSREGDSPVLPDLLRTIQTDEQICRRRRL